MAEGKRIVVCRNDFRGAVYDKSGSTFFERKVYWRRRAVEGYKR